MTINEAIEHAEAQAYKCHGTECGNEHAELARWLRELRARRETGDTCGRQCEGTAYRIELRRLQREMPDLSPVIAWLENDCDPKEAAKELRIYQKRMRSNAPGKPTAANEPNEGEDMSKPKNQTEAADGGSALTAELGTGVVIVLNWGTSLCMAEVLAKTDDRFFIKMDWGGKEVMDITELLRRKCVVFGRKRLPF